MHFQPRSKIKKFKENLHEKGEFESTTTLDLGSSYPGIPLKKTENFGKTNSSGIICGLLPASSFFVILFCIQCRLRCQEENGEHQGVEVRNEKSIEALNMYHGRYCVHCKPLILSSHQYEMKKIAKKNLERG